MRPGVDPVLETSQRRELHWIADKQGLQRSQCLHKATEVETHLRVESRFCDAK